MLSTTYAEVLANAFKVADAIHDGNLDHAEASQLVAAGRVYLRIRYGNGFAFAPAKFIGYANNDVASYRITAKARHGADARKAVSKVLGFDASIDDHVDQQLENYCAQIGVKLHENRHSFWCIEGASGNQTSERSAVHDLEENIGNDDPEYRKRMRGNYTRVEAVRRAVLARAQGRCEDCGQIGFKDRNGRPFLETHHVISLSEQGHDRPSNAIALCPNDHRKAHFGEAWQQTQDHYLAKSLTIGCK